MLFEWVPKTTPGYKPAVHVWMDVTNCMPSDFPAKTGSYNKKSAEVAVKHDGELLFVYGHVHDGMEFALPFFANLLSKDSIDADQIVRNNH